MGYDTSFQALLAAGWDEEAAADIARIKVEEDAKGRTILVATHLLGDWEGRADRCLLVEDGRSQGELLPDRLREVFPRLARETGDASLFRSCA